MNYPESLVRHLMRTVRCSVCEATYESDDVSVLGHQDELWFVAVRCASCQTQGLIAALVRDGALEEDSGGRPDGAAAGQRPTPWSPDPLGKDPARAADRGPITESDVDDMREFLQDFQGGMGALLGNR
jgi:hypothetical protein